MTDSHHDTAQCDKRGRGESELFRAQQRGDDDITAGLQLPIGFHHDPAAQVVQQERLVGLGNTQLPGEAGMLDAALGRRARTAIIAADEHHIGMSFGDAGGDGPHTHLRHQLDVDPGILVGVLQVVDQFRQILDGVDVVVRGRRNQPHAGCRVAYFGDPRVDLAARQLPAFAGLGALGHLDLEFLGIDQVLAGDTESARGHLFDGAGKRVAVGERDVADRVLAAFARIALATDAIHGDGQAFVGLLADGAV